jgi:hypothetical protein
VKEEEDEEKEEGREGRARPKIEKVNQDLFIALYQLLRLIPLFPPPPSATAVQRIFFLAVD